MKIGIGSDHRGYLLKKEIINILEKEGYTMTDYGTYSEEPADYPDFGFKVGEALQRKEVDLGILLCGTGIGISIAANKVKGVRCARIVFKEDAMYARLHNNANAIAIGVDTSLEQVLTMVHTYLETSFSKEERHQRRVDKIDRYEV